VQPEAPWAAILGGGRSEIFIFFLSKIYPTNKKHIER